MCGNYFHVGRGLSLNNLHIFQQLIMSKNLLGLPVLCFGDFNIDIIKFVNFGLHEADGFQIVEMAEGPTTKYGKDQIKYSLTAGGMESFITHIHTRK